MAGTLRDIKEKLNATQTPPNNPAGDSTAPPKQSEEQTFNILPHPATTNDPADLQSPGEGGLRSSQGAFEAFKAAPGPVVPNEDLLKNLPPAKTREELDALQAQLNK